MEWNIESILLDLGTDYRIKGQQRKTPRGIAYNNQATLEDLSFCSYEGYAGISAILESITTIGSHEILARATDNAGGQEIHKCNNHNKLNADDILNE
jgi:hypothetical protein